MDKTDWQKFTDTLESIYTVFSALAKNFLSVAINAQSVLNAAALGSDSM